MKVGAARLRSRLRALRNPRHWVAAAADRHEAAHQVTHHVMEERVGAEAEVNEVACSTNIDLMEVFDRRLGLAFRGSERRESCSPMRHSAALRIGSMSYT